MELACDIYVFLAHMQEAQTGSPDSSVDETARTPLPDTVRNSHAKKALINSGIHITVSDHPWHSRSYTHIPTQIGHDKTTTTAEFSESSTAFDNKTKVFSKQPSKAAGEQVLIKNSHFLIGLLTHSSSNSLTHSSTHPLSVNTSSLHATAAQLSNAVSTLFFYRHFIALLFFQWRGFLFLFLFVFLFFFLAPSLGSYVLNFAES